jgi:hypothetical protein
VSLCRDLETGGKVSLCRDLETGRKVSLCRDLETGRKVSLCRDLETGGKVSLCRDLETGRKVSLCRAHPVLQRMIDFFLLFQTMYIYCDYPAMLKIQNNYQVLLKRSETSISFFLIQNVTIGTIKYVNHRLI